MTPETRKQCNELLDIAKDCWLKKVQAVGERKGAIAVLTDNRVMEPGKLPYLVFKMPAVKACVALEVRTSSVGPGPLDQANLSFVWGSLEAHENERLTCVANNLDRAKAREIFDDGAERVYGFFERLAKISDSHPNRSRAKKKPA